MTATAPADVPVRSLRDILTALEALDALNCPYR